MNVTRTSPIKITYGQLKQTLTSLGFEQKETEAFTAYREADHDALIILPRMFPETFVGIRIWWQCGIPQSGRGSRRVKCWNHCLYLWQYKRLLVV